MRQRVPSVFLATMATGSVVALLSAQAPTPAPPAATAQGTITFARDIKPIFEKTCWNCHGAGLQLADLDLSTREGALKGGEHGASIVPGNSQQSKLYRAVAGLDDIVMPMEGDKLTPSEIAAVKAWIDQGAQWEAAAAAAPKPAAASSAIAALENREITPAERNYWAFKLPV
jgi:hypothetical protein